MEYDYGFEYAFPDMMEGAAGGMFAGAAGIITGIFVILYLMLMGFSVVSYVLNAVGLYRVAKRRGIHHAWLAWIPVGCNWLLGSISDHYQYVANQKNTVKRRILLILSLILLAVSVAFISAIVAMVLSVESAAGASAAPAVAAIVLMVLSYLGIFGLGLAVTVFCYIAYYDLFKSCKPGSAVLFLVLGILFNVTLPFFVFACSGSDKGMPERRAPQSAGQIPFAPAEMPAEEAVSPVEEIPVVEAEIVEDPE